MAGFRNPDVMYTSELDPNFIAGVKRIGGNIANSPAAKGLGYITRNVAAAAALPVNAGLDVTSKALNVANYGLGGSADLFPTNRTEQTLNFARTGIYGPDAASALPIARPTTPRQPKALPGTQPVAAPAALRKLGPQDLSRMSDGSLPPRRGVTPSTSTPGTKTPSANTQPIAAPPMQLAGERIYEYKAPGITDISENSLAAGLTGNDAAFDASRKQDMQSGISTALTSDEIKSYNIGANGGIASMDGRTFILPARGAQEERQYQAQQAQWEKERPIAGIAAPQTTTIGTAKGVFNVAQGESLPPEAFDMTLGDMMVTKFNSKRAEERSRMNIANAKLPYEIAGLGAAADYHNMLTNKGTAMTPYEMAASSATSDATRATTANNNLLAPIIRENYKSEIEFRKAQESSMVEKLNILKEHNKQQLEQSRKGTTAYIDSAPTLKAWQMILDDPNASPEQKQKVALSLDAVMKHGGFMKPHTTYASATQPTTGE